MGTFPRSLTFFVLTRSDKTIWLEGTSAGISGTMPKKGRQAAGDTMPYFLAGLPRRATQPRVQSPRDKLEAAIQELGFILPEETSRPTLLGPGEALAAKAGKPHTAVHGGEGGAWAGSVRGLAWEEPEAARPRLRRSCSALTRGGRHRAPLTSAGSRGSDPGARAVQGTCLTHTPHSRR